MRIASARPDLYDDPDPLFDEPEDEDEEAALDCGRAPDGTCTHAGTEYCEFECPYGND